ncbi:myotrophin-like, partial [Sitodiplosis mosellana]|uniref:myotrophin-like n=1 Tax=Sitodiplosis mosellana TaxID=263140 RepID=UPI00244467A9
ATSKLAQLFRFIETDQLSEITRLIEEGVDLSERYEDGDMAIHWAARLGKADTVKLLIENGANVNARGQYNRTPLYYAVDSPEATKLEVVKVLLENGANVDVKDDYGSTPLAKAAQIGHKKIVEQLIKNGANINLKAWLGRSPLVEASEH